MVAGSTTARAWDSADSQEVSATIEAIVVTARKRAEPLQEIPLSATVIAGTAISVQDILSIQDLATTLPAVKFAKGGVADSQFIRGIGSGDNPSFEQSVGTFIDDIYYGRSRSAEGALFDIDRVEVLKGPQITYFGNNAIAGALNIVTRDPDMSFGGTMRLAYTPKFDGYTAEAGVDLPINSTVGVRLASLATGGDGWIKDYGTGENAPHTRNEAVRGTLVWKPTERLTARFKAQYSQERERGGLPIVRSNCPQFPPFPSPAGFCAVAINAAAAPYSDDFARNTSAGQLTQLTAQDYVGTLTLNQAAFTISSVTGITRYTFALDTDIDGTPFNLLSGMAPERYRQFSQELRIVSVNTSPVAYTAGAYYQHGRLNVQDAFAYGFLGPEIASIPSFAPLLPYLPYVVNDQFGESSDTRSAFGALNWSLTDRLRATGALRYTTVKKEFEQTVAVGTDSANFGPVLPFPSAVAPLATAFAQASNLATVGTLGLSREDSHLAPSLSVQDDIFENAMIYARYDNGFKAGGFNGSDLSGNAPALPFAPEKVDSFEIGAKTRLLNNRATLYIDVFRSQYSGLQLAGIAPSVAGTYVNRVQNAGGAVSRGIEIDAGIRITPHLRASLAATFLSNYYTSYPNATPTSLQTLRGMSVQTLTGRDTPFAPKFSASGTVVYAIETSSAIAYHIENRLFASSRYLLAFNNDPNLGQRGYARDDLTLAVAGKSGWEASVTGQNLSNTTIRTYGAAAPVTLGSYAFMTEPPRTVTIQVQITF